MMNTTYAMPMDTSGDHSASGQSNGLEGTTAPGGFNAHSHSAVAGSASGSGFGSGFGSGTGGGSGAVAPPPTEKEQQHEILRSMSTPDAIMESTLLPNIKQYMRLRGPPAAVVRELSENYQGFAQMCNLLMDWLKLTDMPEAEIQTLLESQLKQFALSRFDRELVDTKFTASSTAPVWLDMMISHSSWRSLIYQLSEAHSESVLLNYAIKKISDAGHQEEMASVATASTDALVFSRVLVFSVFNFVRQDEDAIKEALPDFVKTVCHGEHTYLYAQALFHALNLRRLFQEVQLYAVDTKNDSIARHVGLVLNGSPAFPQVTSAVASMLNAKSCTPGDINTLTKCYCPAAPGMPLPTAGSLAAPTMAAGNPPVDPTLIPPIELLRDPDLFSILISALFDPRKPVNPQHRGKYLAILAFAASVYDIPTDSADATNGGLPMDLETAVRTTSSITGKSVRRVLDFYDVTYAALDAAHTICHKHSSSSDLQADMRALCPHLTFPVVAACVLYWIEVALISTHLLSNSFTTSTPPWHLAVLDEIAFQHSLHRPKVFALLQQLFAAEFDLDALVELSLKKAIFDRCIFLLSLDYVIPIVKFARECLVSDRVDLSLIRHFSSEVVEIVDAPYSKQFLDEFLPIVVDQRVVDGFKKGDQTAPFSQFFDSVVHSEQFSHLSEALQTSVKERLEAWRV